MIQVILQPICKWVQINGEAYGKITLFKLIGTPALFPHGWKPLPFAKASANPMQNIDLPKLKLII